MSTIEMVTVPVVVTLTPGHPDFDHDYEYNSDQTIVMHKPATCISTYAITRHFGGPEEGGWWYNASCLVASIPLMNPGDPEEAAQLTTLLESRHEDEGDIYSVLGGVEFHTMPEHRRGENHDTARPIYC